MECAAEGQLMLCILGPKVLGKPIPNYGITIHECDLYGEKNPWEIWEALGGANNENNGRRSREQLYIFSTMKFESRVRLRNIGLGKWEPHCRDENVSADDGTNRLMGVRRCFRFNKSGTPHDSAWILHEYTLSCDYLTPPSNNYGYVLCKLFKNYESPIWSRGEQAK